MFEERGGVVNGKGCVCQMPRALKSSEGNSLGISISLILL